MAVVTFDLAAWVARYPEFNGTSAAAARSYFTEATIYMDNTDGSPVADTAIRALLLNMLTAHIAALNGAATSGNSAPQMIGRISQASEGSVSASTAFIDPTSELEAWATQTPYGVAWWAATRQYRGFAYVPKPDLYGRRW